MAQELQTMMAQFTITEGASSHDPQPAGGLVGRPDGNGKGVKTLDGRLMGLVVDEKTALSSIDTARALERAAPWGGRPLQESRRASRSQ